MTTEPSPEALVEEWRKSSHQLLEHGACSGCLVCAMGDALVRLVAKNAELEAEVERLRKRTHRKVRVQDWGTVTWEVHYEAWKRYAAKYGKKQSAEDIARRGGFSAGEMDAFYPGWKDASSEVAMLRDIADEAERRLEAAEAKGRDWERHHSSDHAGCEWGSDVG